MAGKSQFAALGVALGLRRNTAECMFAMLKHRGVGLQGNVKARWIKTKEEMDFVLGGTLFGITLRRGIYADGSYEKALDEAIALDLLKFGKPSNYKTSVIFRVVTD